MLQKGFFLQFFVVGIIVAVAYKKVST